MKIKTTWVALAAIGAFLLTGAAACDEYSADAPMGPADNTAPAQRVMMPDGFSNAATKCDHGNRVYTLFHGSGAGMAPYGAIAVVAADPTCKEPAK